MPDDPAPPPAPALGEGPRRYFTAHGATGLHAPDPDMEELVARVLFTTLRPSLKPSRAGCPAAPPPPPPTAPARARG